MTNVNYNTEVLKSNLCDYYDAYMLASGDITIIGDNVHQVAFKNCALLTKRITKIDGTAIDDAENLDLVLSMYSSSSYSETTESLWFYSNKDEATNCNADIANTEEFKSSKYKTKLRENNEADGANGVLRNVAIAVLLKYICNFWRSLEMLFINCKVELKYKWTKYCVLSAAGADNVNDNVNNNVNGNNIIFTIKDTKLYVPVVTLTARDNEKLSKLLSKGKIS